MMCIKRSIVLAVAWILTACALFGSVTVAQARGQLTAKATWDLSYIDRIAPGYVALDESGLYVLGYSSPDICVNLYSLDTQDRVQVWQEADPLAGLGMMRQPLLTVTEDSVFVRVLPRHHVLRFDKGSGVVDRIRLESVYPENEWMGTGHTGFAADSQFLYIRNIELGLGKQATLQKYSFDGTMQVSSQIRPLTTLIRQRDLLHVISNREIVTLSTDLEYISEYVMKEGDFFYHSQWAATEDLLIALDSVSGTLHITDLKDAYEIARFERPLWSELEEIQLLSYGNRVFILDTVARLLYELDLTPFLQGDTAS